MWYVSWYCGGTRDVVRKYVVCKLVPGMWYVSWYSSWYQGCGMQVGTRDVVYVV